jgi:hypothetical protein
MIADKILLYGAALLIALGGTALVAQFVRVGQLRTELSATKLVLETERRQAAEAGRAAHERYRAEEIKQASATLEGVRHAHSSLSRADAAGVRAAAAGSGLRARADALAARCGGAAEAQAAAPGGPSPQEAGFLLADVSRRLEEAGRRLADFAERSLIAAETCERIGDAEVKP